MTYLVDGLFELAAAELHAQGLLFGGDDLVGSPEAEGACRGFRPRPRSLR